MARFSRRSWAFLAVTTAASLLFLRLGIWQIERLGERRAINETRAALADLPPVRLDGHPAERALDSLLWRRVLVAGTLDFDREIVVRGRAAHGSPGVHLLTPLRTAGGSTVLVLRGWLPAADGVSAELAGSRTAPAAGGDGPAEQATVEVAGRLRPGEAPSPIPPRRATFGGAGEHLVLGSIDLDAAATELGDDLVRAWVLPDTTLEVGADRPPRAVTLPPPSDGPHLLYAIQWFGFALITVAGAIVYLSGRATPRPSGRSAT